MLAHLAVLRVEHVVFYTHTASENIMPHTEPCRARIARLTYDQNKYIRAKQDAIVWLCEKLPAETTKNATVCDARCASGYAQAWRVLSMRIHSRSSYGVAFLWRCFLARLVGGKCVEFRVRINYTGRNGDSISHRPPQNNPIKAI